MKKFALGFILLLALCFVMVSLPEINIVKASGTIYIRNDGSVEGTDKIHRDGNVYTFTSDIFGSIIVERNNIVVDGADYTLQGTGNGIGIELSYRSNVTIKNMEIKAFNRGIYLFAASNNTISGNNVKNNNNTGIEFYSSSNNTITGNNIVNTPYGIWLRYYSNNNSISGNNITNNVRGVDLLESSKNTISGNNITNNEMNGIWIWSSSNNTINENNVENNDNGIMSAMSSNVIFGNNVTANTKGIWFQSSSYSNIIGNTIANNSYGIYFSFAPWAPVSSNNIFYHNNFINNTNQVYAGSGHIKNTWDNGYLSGGNYWDDYEARCPDATELDGSGIWDTPYVINENNQDNYPIVPEFPAWTSILLILIVLTVATVIYKRRLLKTPIH